jgi:hypothetical protein
LSQSARAVTMQRVSADDLYGLALDRFVAERGALVKSLRKAGRREEAVEVAQLRKPSTAAWAVNQLVRTQRAAIQELFDAGDALRNAQSDLLAGRGDGRTLRAAGDRERAAVDGLVEIARGLLGSAGDELSATAIERVADTLHAAALDEGAREQVRAGCLERELRHIGLGLGLGEGDASVSRNAAPRAGRRGKETAAAGSAATETARGGTKPGATAVDPAAGSAATEAARGGTKPGATAVDPAAGSATTAAAHRGATTDATNAADAEPTPPAQAKRAERARAAEQRAAAELVRRERAAARRDARAAHATARRRADAAIHALHAAEERRDEAAEQLRTAQEALATANDDAAKAAAALRRAASQLADAEHGG